eukprot:CAMPEP_0183767252 /NCGR_PEP_ID=MMETSP0739-20130205/12077_1 /TAXON_ID=385413 /ORGANISM="Thalassiosira miniscula, Strain CCMP1093" /LENGTH=268 /DNA_ID=CAMNT_0026006141 /DNA_START=51 /DNA_END=857 /DNA_ORIENTATION=-
MNLSKALSVIVGIVSAVDIASAKYAIVCGMSDHPKCIGKEPRPAAVEEKHALRCCSSTQKDGWERRWKFGCSIWAQTKFDGVCYDDVDFSEADTICESKGGRLCTKEEILNDCTAGTGCKFNSKFIWTSTPWEGDDLPLEWVGNNGGPAFPLGRCQGDCDKDTDCQGDLVCFDRDGDTADAPVPGCSGYDDTGDDFCTVRPSETYLAYMGNSGVPADKFPLKLCEGDCDNDSECDGELVCFNRNGRTPVPGCEGAGMRGKDYCHNDAD